MHYRLRTLSLAATTLLLSLLFSLLSLERRSTNNREPDSPLSMSAEMPIFRHGLDYWTGALGHTVSRS